MRSKRGAVGTILVLTWVLFSVVLPGRAAQALDACTAAEIASQDFGCVATSTICRITQSFDIGDGCELDFASRPLTIAGSGRLGVGRGTMTIKATSLTVENGGSIDARGTSATPNNRGGFVRIETQGAVEVRGPLGVIDVSGSDDGGTLIVQAGGSINVSGKLISNGLLGFAFGGELTLRSEGDIVTTDQSAITSLGTRDGGGGSINFTAGGRIDLGALIDVSGGCGGSLDTFSRGETVVREIRSRGTGDAGSGGCLTLIAGTTLRTLDLVDLDGTSGTSGGGCGGFICLEAVAGDIVIESDIRAEGAAPDGGGGLLALIAPGAITTQPETTISVRGNGIDTCGGEVCIDAGTRLDGRAAFDTSGGSIGGDVDITAGGNVSIIGGIFAGGRTVGGFAGTTLIDAGSAGPGNLNVTGMIDLDAGGCSASLGCGFGGFAQLRSCNLTVASSGGISGRAPEGGEIELIAREQLTVSGPLDARSSNLVQGAHGEVLLSFPSRKPATVVSGLVQPPPTLTPMDTCTLPRQPACLNPCPTCGNGQVEFPEGCDQLGPPMSCDGCSVHCQLEDCDDGRDCTIDTCNPAFGCSHAPRELPPTPCFEPSERSPTPTPSGTATATTSPTRTITDTPTVTPTLTITGTPTDTPPATDTPTAEPTATPPGCVGDCDGNGQATVEELVLGVDLMLDGGAPTSCSALDVDGDDTIEVDELLIAIGSALNGCETAIQ